MIKYEPISGREQPRFAGIKTFFRLPHVAIDADYDLGILGVPYDGGTSYRPGARFAPTRVREISSLGRVYHWGRMQSFTEKLKVADIGDCPVVPIDMQKTYARIQEFYKKCLLNKKKLIAVGGDHSITLPILREMRAHYGVPLALIHFDAHLDTYPAAWDCEYHHGSFLRHAIEEGLVDPKKTVQIGIRGPLAGGADLDFVNKHGLRVFTMDHIRDNFTQFIAGIPQFGDTPAYLTYDVDCLDPVYAPGTGTPVPGGLTTFETQRILRTLRVANLVGADVVEVSPPFDQSDLTSLAAMDAVFELISLFAANV